MKLQRWYLFLLRLMVEEWAFQLQIRKISINDANQNICQTKVNIFKIIRICLFKNILSHTSPFLTNVTICGFLHTPSVVPEPICFINFTTVQWVIIRVWFSIVPMVIVIRTVVDPIPLFMICWNRKITISTFEHFYSKVL